MKLRKLFIFSISCLLFSIYSKAQDITVKGKVVDEKGMSVSGASVLIQGTKNGASTDFDGSYSIKVPSNASITVSFIGYKSKTLPVNGQSTINFNLAPENSVLNEVVVVGYGTQKRSLVTGTISSIKAKALTDNPTSAIGQILQGRVSGVSVTASSGEPGAGSTIRVRGITTFNSSSGGNDPLWVVDGIIVDNGGIGYVNQSDIESIETIKDAATLAIYGASANAGVILITTKKGTKGKMAVNYNGFTGFYGAARKLNLLNATQYATIVNEKSIAAGGNEVFPLVLNPLTGLKSLDYLGKGTDWQSKIFNDAAVNTNHEINLSGGNDVSNFFASIGYQNKEGIVTTDVSGYKKLSMRLNSNHIISKYFTFGQTLGFTHEDTKSIGDTNTEFGGPLSSALNLDPTTPFIETDPEKLKNNPYSGFPVILDSQGRPYGISSIVGQEITNPVAFAQTRLGNYNYANNFVANAYLEIKPSKNWTFKSTVAGKLSNYGSEYFNPRAYLAPAKYVTENNINREVKRSFGVNVENTLTYTKESGNHNFVFLLGQGFYKEGQESASGTRYQGLPVNDYKLASFNFDIPQSRRSTYAYDKDPSRRSSLFARLNYNFKQKYIFTGILRRDGSSNFGFNKKYGYFPSFSGGWVVSKEGFWKENNIFTSLKLRGGYGKNGGSAIRAFTFASNIVGGINYTFGPGGLVGTGTGPESPANPDLKWETVTSSDFGIDATLFNDLNLTVNVFNKETSDILQEVQIPGFVGQLRNPTGNVATMTNKGVEVELGYRHNFKGLNVSVNGNVSTLENKVTFLGDGKAFITDGAASFQSMGPITRSAVGQSYNSFYGYQTAGIFQNDADVANYKNAAGTPIQPDAKPGDFRWVDNNNDGKISDDDKTYIGTSIPKLNFGLTLNLDYKGFDFSVFFQGATGNKIFQGLRRLDIGNANYQTEALNRWTGEGTSNTYPRLVDGDPNGNFGKPSNFYLQDGDYARLKLITLGYSLPRKVIEGIGATKIRLYVTGQNLATFTKYTGFEPEIGGDISGVDKGVYPQPKGFLLGANLQF
jgi:TonB-dependent starch-binding outer membrane protein SusC